MCLTAHEPMEAAKLLPMPGSSQDCCRHCRRATTTVMSSLFPPGQHALPNHSLKAETLSRWCKRCDAPQEQKKTSALDQHINMSCPAQCMAAEGARLSRPCQRPRRRPGSRASGCGGPARPGRPPPPAGAPALRGPRAAPGHCAPVCAEPLLPPQVVSYIMSVPSRENLYSPSMQDRRHGS